jgi:hypothetical protein
MRARLRGTWPGLPALRELAAVTAGGVDCPVPVATFCTPLTLSLTGVGRLNDDPDL